MKDKYYKERDHGYGDPPEPSEPPTVVSHIEAECPNCGCKGMFIISVTFDEDADLPLKGKGKAKGTYAGCAACPYASPMMTARS